LLKFSLNHTRKLICCQ